MWNGYGNRLDFTSCRIKPGMQVVLAMSCSVSVGAGCSTIIRTFEYRKFAGLVRIGNWVHRQHKKNCRSLWHASSRRVLCCKVEYDWGRTCLEWSDKASFGLIAEEDLRQTDNWIFMPEGRNLRLSMLILVEGLSWGAWEATLYTVILHTVSARGS